MDERVAEFALRLRECHERFRELLSGIEPEALTTAPPVPETNSIADIVGHILRSEARCLGRLTGRPYDPHLSNDWQNTPVTAAELLQQLEGADRSVDELGRLIGAEGLHATYPHHGATMTGYEYLVFHYGHEREHIAHAELTRQLIHQWLPVAERTPS